MMRAVTLLAGLASLAACAAIVGVDDRHGTRPDAGSSAPATSPEPDGGDISTGDAASPAGEATAQTLGSFEDPTLSVGEEALLVVDVADGRSAIHRIPKSDPKNPKKIYDAPSDVRSSRVSTAALARHHVWFTTADGTIHRMTPEGTNPTLVDASGSSILARSAQALWTASPDALTTAPTLRWRGDDLLSSTPEATLAFGELVAFPAASDDELVFLSRTSNAVWSVRRWRPFAKEPLVTLARFDPYPGHAAVDSERVLVFYPDEGTVVAFSRTSPAAAPVTILAGVSSPIAMASDGVNLVLRSQSSITTCAIARCAETMRPLRSPAAFAKARYLAIDERWAYFFQSKSDTGPMTLVRVPR